MLLAAFITFFSFWIVLAQFDAKITRRVVGYKTWFNIILHGLVIWLFMGNFAGLMQAECAAIMLSLWMWIYRQLCGYEVFRWSTARWVRYTGYLTKGDA